MKTVRLLSILALAALLLSALLAGATVITPATLSYQGSMFNTDGTPLTGVKSMTFSLYSTTGGKTALWTEPQTDVNIVNGRFATILGNTTPIESGVFSSRNIYLGVTVAGDASELSPRQQLTSVAFAHKAENGVPVGGIIMWSGSTVPSGWALCNGQTVNGRVTPDLRNKFVMGASAAAASGWPTGGTTTGSTDGTALTVAQMPSHDHDLPVDNGMNPYMSMTGTGIDRFFALATGSGQWAHSAGAGSGAAHSHSVTWGLPPYYALAYIMRVQ